MGKKIKKNIRKKFTAKLQLEKVNWEKVEKIFSVDRELVKKRLKTSNELDSKTKDILLLLAGGAVIALSFMFPTLPMALAPFIVDSNRYEKKRFSQTIRRLRKQKLVEITELEGYKIVRITDEGRVRALRYKLDEIQIEKPKIWDKKWRLVVFDIPEKEKRMRDIFRDHLKTMGFYQLQKSVWVHPYPCFEEIEFLRQIYNVGINVTYIKAENIEGAENLKSFFQLD